MYLAMGSLNIFVPTYMIQEPMETAIGASHTDQYVRFTWNEYGHATVEMYPKNMNIPGLLMGGLFEDIG